MNRKETLEFMEKLPVEPSVYYRYLKYYFNILLFFKLGNVNYTFVQDLLEVYNILCKEKIDYNTFLKRIKLMEKDKLIRIFKVNGRYNAIALDRLGLRLLYVEGLSWTDTTATLKFKKEHNGLVDKTRQDPNKITNPMLLRSSLKLKALTILNKRNSIGRLKITYADSTVEEFKEIPIYRDSYNNLHLIILTGSIAKMESIRKHLPTAVNNASAMLGTTKVYIHTPYCLDNSSVNYIKNTKIFSYNVEFIVNVYVDALKPFGYLPVK